MPKSQKQVMAFGTFDLLHKGHIFFLKKAKELGEKLIVVVARDTSVEKIKGKKPVNNQTTRLEAVKSLPFIDKAVIGKKISERLKLIKEIKPDVIALGYDQKPSKTELQKALAELNLKPKIVRLKPFKANEFKSSKLRQKLKA